MTPRMRPWPKRFLASRARARQSAEARALLRAPWTPLDPDVHAQVFERARQRVQRPSWSGHAAVAVALAAAFALAFSLGDDPDPVRDSVGAAQVRVVRGTAEIAVDGTWQTAHPDARIALPARLRAADGSSLRVRTSRGARLDVDEGTELDVALDGVRVARGGVRHSVAPGNGDYRVSLGGVEVIVTGTVFWTGTDGMDAAVCVIEGGVRVMRDGAELVTLGAGEGWRSSAGGPRFPAAFPCDRVAPEPPRGEPSPAAGPATDVAAEAPVVTRSRLRSRDLAAPESVAHENEHTGCARADDPVACYRRLAGGDGLAAEGALYQLGRLHRREGRAADAIETWREHERRFPSGTLIVEVRLAELETLLASGSPDAIDRADAFLDLHDESAHGAEVHVVRGTLRHRRGELPGALADYEAALARALPDWRRDEALFGHATCLDALGRSSDADAAYRAYLAERPEGRFADRVRARLGGR